ncbi:MAG: dicarboxylate/amino acid:cation symporter [candidate division Zixibacteria bacterium]|nr:dicarboxylate/amino acid:cation symporter [candidate division Zixibacteria bacterium]
MAIAVHVKAYFDLRKHQPRHLAQASWACHIGCKQATPDSMTVQNHSASPKTPHRTPLHRKILYGLAVGVVAGLGCNLALGGDDLRLVWVIRQITEPVGQLFLRLLLMVVVPLVFSSLVVGVAGIGNLRTLGRVGLKCFAYTFVISAISVAIGLTLANVIKPGKRIAPSTAQALEQRYGGEAAKRIEGTKKPNDDSAFLQVIKTLVPSNPIAAVSAETPNMLHLMFFALVLGVAATLVPEGSSRTFVRLMDSVFSLSTKLIDIIMLAAPYAVACLLFSNLAQFGIDLLAALGWFVVTVLLGLSLHMFGVYSLSVYLLSRLNPIDFFRRIRTVMITAFSTSSSNATLPTALAETERNLGVPRELNTFVLTIGATANQNGTALYEGVTVIFLAQLSGIDLSIGQQIMIAYLAMLGSIGTAGVPSGSIPFIIIVLATIGVNPALIAIILGVDRLLDMCRTTLNVTGDITAATYIARSEGHQLIPRSPNG